ncbi:MAG: hypothetical protein WCL37_05190 [Chrysiogenales bacterium]
MKKNSKQAHKKVKYEPPLVISLGDLNVANGAACSQGASADNQCHSGSTATGSKCFSGSVASGGKCNAGSVAGGQCTGGSAPR